MTLRKNSFKKKTLFVLALGVIALPVFADESPVVDGAAQSLDLGYQNSISVLIGDKLANDNADAGLYAEFDWLKTLDRAFSAGIGVGYNRVDNPDNILSAGTITMIPVLFKVRARTLEGNPFCFLEGGVGEYFFDHQLNQESTDFYNSYDVTVSEKLKTTVGGFIGAGFNIYKNSSAGFGLTIQRHFVKPKFDGTAVDNVTGDQLTVSEKLNLNFTLIAINVIAHF